jgi:hypothetical protein
MTDLEIVERFQRLHDPDRRVVSLWGYRQQMKQIAPRLLKILIDGLVLAPQTSGKSNSVEEQSRNRYAKALASPSSEAQR